MLLPDKVKVAVATVVKPHGIKGELNVLLSDMAEPDDDFAPGACLIVEIEGLDVPFFVESARSRGADSLLVQLTELSNEAEAAEMTGRTLYVYADPESLADDDELTAGALIGYEILPSDASEPIGRIADVTELTPGCWYFVLEGSEKLIPAVDEMISGIDPDARTVSMTLPEGLTEL